MEGKNVNSLSLSWLILNQYSLKKKKEIKKEKIKKEEFKVEKGFLGGGNDQRKNHELQQ